VLLPLPTFHFTTGNIAIDAALVVLWFMGAKHVVEIVARKLRCIYQDRARSREIASELRNKNQELANLNQNLLSARRNTEAAVNLHLEDLDNRGRVASASSELERDPRFSELEAQLTEASNKSRYLSH